MKRNAKLDGLRFLFAVAVMILHSNTFQEKGHWFPGAVMGVEFFLILSGYLMAVSIQKKNERGEEIEDLGQETWDFLARKLRSFMPELLASLIIGFSWMEVVWQDGSIRLLVKRLLSIVWEPLLLSTAGFGTVRINGVDWYLSAMIFAMLILYPICRKYFSMSTHVIMPAAAILIFGYFCREYGKTSGVYTEIGFVYKCLLRAFAGLALGLSCYPIITGLKKRKYTERQRILLTVAETVIYLGVFGYMFRYSKKQFDMVCLLMIVVGFCITSLEQGCLDHLFSQKVCAYLGKASLIIFFSHSYIGRALGVLLPGRPYLYVLGIYVALSAINAGAVYALAVFIRRHFFLQHSERAMQNAQNIQFDKKQ